MGFCKRRGGRASKQPGSYGLGLKDGTTAIIKQTKVSTMSIYNYKIDILSYTYINIGRMREH